VQVQLPNLSLVKQVDNTAAGSLGLSAKDWTLTATPKRGKTASGAGGFDSAYLPQGQTVLSESSSSPKSAGYKATVSCVPHPNSDIRTPSSTVNSASKTLDLATGEWMQCTMVNTAQPGQVVWSKVDDAGNPRAGTVFTLASPALNGVQKEVPDCVVTGGKATCPNGSVDQDPRAGFFKVSGLTWGEYSITETQAPAGYHLSSTTLTKTLDGSAPAAGTDDDTPTLDPRQVTNTRIKGSATWTKTDERGNPIKGSQWSLVPLDSNGRPQPDQARTIRIPVHMVEVINKLARVQRQMLQDLGREPTPEELGKELDMTPEKVIEVQKYGREPISLHTPLGEDGDSEFGDLIEDSEAVVPADAVSFTLLQEQLHAVLDTLSEREAGVVSMRFGLTDGQPKTLDEIGKVYGVTRERIRQIESKALAKLRLRCEPHFWR